MTLCGVKQMLLVRSASGKWHKVQLLNYLLKQQTTSLTLNSKRF
jgi:hypothetical protein